MHTLAHLIGWSTFSASLERHHPCPGSLPLTYQGLNCKITHQDKIATATFAPHDTNKDRLFRNQMEMLDNSWCLKGTKWKQFEKYGKADVHSKCDSPLTLSSASPPNLYLSLCYIFYFAIIMAKIPSQIISVHQNLPVAKETYMTISHPFTVCYPIKIQSSEELVQTGPAPSLLSESTPPPETCFSDHKI